MINNTNPKTMLAVVANQGTVNDIPLNPSTTDPQLANYQDGFPSITQTPVPLGGIPPERADFNGLFNLTSSHNFFLQNGGAYTFNEEVANAINGYPAGALLWYTQGDEVMLLQSQKGNNMDNFVTDNSFIGVSWMNVLGGGAGTRLPLFVTQWSDHLIEDISWLRADTFSWQSGDVYIACYNELVAQYNDSSVEDFTDGAISGKRTPKGYKIVDASQEGAVLNAYNSTGIAWYYILDIPNKRFKLPRTKFGFTGLRGGVGNEVQAGLPNITGNTTDHYGSFPIAWANGAFDSVKGAGQTWGGSGSGQQYHDNFDASRSNPIYGASDTVQPPATEMYLYFYVGNFEQSAIEQTAGLNTELFANKADNDLSNVVDNIDYVVETFENTTNGITSWYRLYRSGWCEQGQTVEVGGNTNTFSNRLTNLLIAYKDTNYALECNSFFIDGIGAINFTAKTNSTFTMASVVRTSGRSNWTARGYTR